MTVVDPVLFEKAVQAGARAIDDSLTMLGVDPLQTSENDSRTTAQVLVGGALKEALVVLLEGHVLVPRETAAELAGTVIADYEGSTDPILRHAGLVYDLLNGE